MKKKKKEKNANWSEKERVRKYKSELMKCKLLLTLKKMHTASTCASFKNRDTTSLS